MLSISLKTKNKTPCMFGLQLEGKEGYGKGRTKTADKNSEKNRH